MKFSVKFREERSPLLRSKVPFKLGPLPLSSAIAIGNKQDLALLLATGFSCGPLIKLSFKPHDPNPVSVILKSGLGLWGSPNDAPFTVAAEICLTPKVHDRLLSVRIKPRFGNFSIRKDVKNVSLLPALQNELSGTSVCLQLHEIGDLNNIVDPQKGENGSVLSAFPTGDSKAVPKQMNGNSLDRDQVHRPSMDSSNVTAGSNFSLRFEGLENGHVDRKSRLETLQEEGMETDLSKLDNSMMVHVPHEKLHEYMKKGGSKSSASFSLVGVHDALRGYKLVTHSSLPMGSQSRLNIRWAVKTPSDLFQGWDGSLPSLSFAKLPSLTLEKISYEQLAVSRVEKTSELGNRGSSEQGLLPVSFVEEDIELAQVSALCYTMKRQLHLMHAENQVLRKAMEDMRSHVETKSSLWTSNGVADGIPKDSSSMPRLPHKSSSLEAPSPSWMGREGSNNNVQGPKSKKASPRREDLHSKSNFTAVSNGDDVSMELEKAILNAQNGSSAGKKE